MAAVIGALAVIANRTVSKTIHFSVVGFYYGVGQLFFNPIVLILYQRTTFPDYTWGLVGLTVLIGIIYFVMQSLLTYGLSVVPASVGAVMFYVAIPASYILDICFMDKKVAALEIIGAVLIVLTNILLTFLKSLKWIK